MPEPKPRAPHETGNAQIDAQHRHMVELFHGLRATAAIDPKDPALDEHLGALLRVTEAHFREEEGLMGVLPDGLERFAGHLAQHQMLLFELVRLRDEHSRGEIGIGPEDLGFLERWLFEHMETFDRELEALEARSREPVPWIEPEA